MPQEPAAIQRQIEQTRAELAETIDAIADVVSPRRVAERASVQIKDKVTELRGRITTPARPELEVGGGLPVPRGGAGSPSTEVTVVRTVRWERVAVVAGTTMLLVGIGRRRRHRRRRRSS